MPDVAALHPALAGPIALAFLVLGACLVHGLDRIVSAVVAGSSLRAALLEPLRFAGHMWRQERSITERPDLLLWVLAPAIYAAVAAAAFTVVPLGEGLALADVRTGIVLFGAAEAIAIVAIFMHGWAANSYLSLIGGYRFVAVALSYELLSMFVLIAAALPAESLQVSAIVTAQADTWNVVRQPLGLPLWIIVCLGVTFWGPLNLADGADVAGGTSAEVSGRHRLLWEIARGGMLAVLAAMGAAMFLGGWLGPWLPGWAWMAIKTLAVLLVVLIVGRSLGRVQSERIVTVFWTALLPVAFAGLALAGWEALR